MTGEIHAACDAQHALRATNAGDRPADLPGLPRILAQLRDGRNGLWSGRSERLLVSALGWRSPKMHADIRRQTPNRGLFDARRLIRISRRQQTRLLLGRVHHIRYHYAAIPTSTDGIAHGVRSAFRAPSSGGGVRVNRSNAIAHNPVGPQSGPGAGKRIPYRK